MPSRVIRWDWAMKTILRDKANFDVLEGFLSALLEDDKIQILQIIESETNANSEIDKFNRVDLLVLDSLNRRIFIEIQNTRESDFLESLLYSSSKIITENQKLGDDFKNISKVISISIMFFNLGYGDDYIYRGSTEFKGLNTGTNLVLKKRQEVMDSMKPKFEFIEKNIFPEYYLISVGKYPNVLQKRIDEWIYMMKNNEIPESFTSRNIDKAALKLAELNMSIDEFKSYEKYIINSVRDRDAFHTAMNDSFQKGEKAGIKQGIEKGAKEKVIEIARKLKAKNTNIEDIIEITGLSKREINKIT